MTNRKVAVSRHASVPKAVKAMQLGADLMLFRVEQIAEQTAHRFVARNIPDSVRNRGDGRSSSTLYS